MSKIKTAAQAVKNHVNRNAIRYAVAGTTLAVAAIALQQNNRRTFDAFLTSKGIDLDEYYCPEYFAEKNA